MVLFFLSSGLFLGWSLGANDAANVFGTAVGSRMVRFWTAAILCSVFVVIGAVYGGGGTTLTLGKLGAVDALAGAFVVAFAAAITVLGMTRVGLPVSTSQAVVGAIIGWNFFAGQLTDLDALKKIVLTWVLCPVLAGLFAAVLFAGLRWLMPRLKIHLLWQDTYIRTSLLIVAAFAAFSLGANNIANVVGVFVPAAPLADFRIGDEIFLTSTQLLFLLGGLSIAVGIVTYSHRVIATVGSSLMKLSPEAALVVVLAQALVLFIFASEDLEAWLQARHLPSFPLVPVSSSQAVVGAVVGIGLLKGGRQIRYRVLGEIASGWVTTPIIAGLIAFVALFFFQNVFDQRVSQHVQYCMDGQVVAYLEEEGVFDPGLSQMVGLEYAKATRLNTALKQFTGLDRAERKEVVIAAECMVFRLDTSQIGSRLDPDWFTPEQIQAVENLAGQEFQRSWKLLETLAAEDSGWRLAPDATSPQIKDLEAKQRFLLRTFRVEQ